MNTPRAGAGLPCATLLLVLGSSPASAGGLSGAVLDEGVTAVLEDVVQLPASAGSPPLARLNVLREAPDASGRIFVNDLRGPLYVIDGGSVSTYLDLATLRPALKTSPGLASGFVSFEFHPDFASNGLFYTVHSETVSGGSPTPNLVPAEPTAVAQHSVLTEWQASDPAADAFSGSSRELMRIAAPHHEHNLGEIAFDPGRGPGDPEYGLLYIGAGDFGSVETGQPEQLQRLDTPLGAVMRIDPLGGPFLRGGVSFDYGIPPSNPYAADGDPDTWGEIYAHGFRNAHRLAWDRGAGHTLFVSDIGQENLDEVNVLVPGANYGWPVREGTYALDPEVDPDTVFALPPGDSGFTYPVAQYDHDEGRAIAGGLVVRGAPSTLYGRFVFGDIVSGRLFYAAVTALRAADDGDPATTAPVYELHLLHEDAPTTLLDVVREAAGAPGLTRVDLRFGADRSGQLYLTTKQDGFVRRLVPLAGPGSVPALGVLAAVGLAALVLGSGLWARAARGRGGRP